MKFGVSSLVTLCAACSWLLVQAVPADSNNESLSHGQGPNDVLYNCSATNSDGWSSNHSDWCCQYEGKGCRFDCLAAYNDRETAWSDSKKAWCCKNRQIGCAGLNLSDQPYDCQKSYWDRADWSQKQQEWCCYHKQLGCYPPTTTLAAAQQLPAVTGAPEMSIATLPTLAPISTTGAHREGGASAAADNSTGDCFEDQTTWEPLDMPGTLGSQAANESECQERCANTTGCVHFTFWWLGKNCHLQDAFAVRQTARVGFVSGPFSCWKDLNQSKYMQKGSATFVTNDYKCVELAALYSPLMGLVKHISSEESGDSIEAVKSCRAHCAATEGCAHFTMIFPQRLCQLAGPGAHKLEGYQGAVSGTPTCWGGVEHKVDEKVDDGELKVIMKTSLRARAQGVLQAGQGHGYAAFLLFAVIAVVAGTVIVAKRAMMARPHAFSWIAVE